jgi:hypothetical protein
MNSSDIMSSMIKGRECCRRLVQTYEQARGQPQAAPSAGSANLNLLRTAETAATQMLSHLSRLPQNPCAGMTDEEAKRHTSQVLGDIRGLLEKAIMLEREMRASAPQWAREKEDGTHG